MSKPLIAVAVSSLLFGACAKQTPPPEAAPSMPPAQTTVIAEAPPPPPEPVAPPVEEPPPPPAPLTDAQIAKVLDTVDNGEIAQAKLAQKKSKNPKVKKFAAHMIQAHTKSNTKAKAWVKKAKLTPEETPVSQELTAKGQQNLATLESADAAGFDAAYIAAQAQQHQEVLSLIDSRLAPGATDDQLKAFLTETRTMVESHATEAKEIEGSLTTATTSAAPTTTSPGVGAANKGPAPGPAAAPTTP
jgi:putative membrane protein